MEESGLSMENPVPNVQAAASNSEGLCVTACSLAVVCARWQWLLQLPGAGLPAACFNFGFLQDCSATACPMLPRAQPLPPGYPSVTKPAEIECHCIKSQYAVVSSSRPQAPVLGNAALLQQHGL